MALTVRYVSSSGVAIYSLSTSILTPMSWSTALANAAAGDWIKILADGTYARTTNADTPTNAGTLTSPIIWEGVSSGGATVTDGRTNGNGPLITTNFPVFTWTTGAFTSTNFNILRHLSIATANSGASVTMGTNTVIESCAIVNSSTNASAACVANAVATSIVDTDTTLSGASGTNACLVLTVANPLIDGGRINGGVGIGVTSTVAFQLLNATIFNCSIGVKPTATGGGYLIEGCTITGCSSDGINIATGQTALVKIANCLITDNAGFGINGVSAANAIYLRNNRYRNNTSGDTNLATDWIAATNLGAVSGGASSDYVNSAGQDYRLASTSPALAAGLPSYADIGALNGNDVSTDPGVANVLSTVSYSFQGASKTGTYVVVSAGNVRSGVTFGAGSGQAGTLVVLVAKLRNRNF